MDRQLLLVGLLVLGTTPLDAQVQATPDDPGFVSAEEIEAARSAPLFLSTDLIEFTLQADFRTIRSEDRTDEAPRRPASLTLMVDGAPVGIELNLQTRGEFRRDPRNCRFPPLWLDFDKDDEELTTTPFAGQNRLKLYVTCQPGRQDYEQYILHEYLLYPIYALFTEVSFRARLARVTYEDSSGRDDAFTSYAFLLEDIDALAARHEGIELDVGVHPARLEQDLAATMELFLYMIGMTDFEIVYGHNSKTVRRMSGAFIPVPYDFDVSGIVNARYAVPDPRLPIRNVRQRIYRGFCRESVDFQAVFARFLTKEGDVRSLYEGHSLLEERRRERALDYIDDFFETLRDEDRARGRILEACRAMPS